MQLGVAPNQLHFYQGSIQEQPVLCESDNTTQAPSIRTLLQPVTERPFNLELITVNAAPKVNGDAPAAPKRLAIILSNGNQLIFTGTAKPLLSPPTGLPISTKLLANYEWHLESAVANHYGEQGKLMNREPISDFYHPDYPISFEIFGQSENSTISFGSNCNGSGAPYFLLDDNTLKVGMIISTMMGCGETGNRIETTLFNFMQESSSTLTLSRQPQSATGSTGDYPRYNLLQTMATGETLIWKNEPKKMP